MTSFSNRAKLIAQLGEGSHQLTASTASQVGPRRRALVSPGAVHTAAPSTDHSPPVWDMAVWDVAVWDVAVWGGPQEGGLGAGGRLASPVRMPPVVLRG